MLVSLLLILGTTQSTPFFASDFSSSELTSISYTAELLVLSKILQESASKWCITESIWVIKVVVMKT